MRWALRQLDRYGGLIVGLCLVGVLLTFGVGAAPEGISGDNEPTRTRQAELQHFLDHDCGSCHGMTRKGGLGSPLDPATLAEKADETLVAIIMDGIPGTPMPPWRPLLSEAEAQWIVDRLREEKASGH